MLRGKLWKPVTTMGYTYYSWREETWSVSQKPWVLWIFRLRVGPVACGVSESVWLIGESLTEGRASWGSLRFVCYSRLEIYVGLDWGSNKVPRSFGIGFSGLRCLLAWTAKLCGRDSDVLPGGYLFVPLWLLTKWFSLTRLETRTKESNIYASIWVFKPWCVMKVKEDLCLWGRTRALLCGALSTDRSLVVDLSKSISVGTRKMVIYAWTGWSQGKLWWKLVAVLTCKSFVWFGYRGERLIEPSSSWFPPKFPSG